VLKYLAILRFSDAQIAITEHYHIVSNG